MGAWLDSPSSSPASVSSRRFRKTFSPRRHPKNLIGSCLLLRFSPCGGSGSGSEFPAPHPPMATKSHKKKKPSAPNPSVDAKAPSSDQKPNPQKPAEEREEAAAAKKPKKQKASNEIEDIFQATKSGKKRKSQQQQQEEAEAAKKPKKGRAEGGSKKSRGKGRDLDDEVGEEKWPRRRTNDGLTIYSAEELGFGKAEAGGTALCPFDCDCCF